MTNYKITLMGQPSLYQKSVSVDKIDEKVQKIINEMQAALKDQQAVGLAAPQIGHNVRIILFGFEDNRYPEIEPIPITLLINPEYTVLGSELESNWEGCVSVPGIRGWVERYKKIKYWGLDGKGNKISATAEGFVARIIQHEIDHLDGILFPSRIRDLKYLAMESVVQKASNS